MIKKKILATQTTEKYKKIIGRKAKNNLKKGDRMLLKNIKF